MDLFKLPCFLITLFAKKKKSTVKKSGSNVECFRTGARLVSLRNRLCTISHLSKAVLTPKEAPDEHG